MKQHLNNSLQILVNALSLKSYMPRASLRVMYRPGHASVVQPLLPMKLHHQTLAQVFGTHLHHLSIRILKEKSNIQVIPTLIATAYLDSSLFILCISQAHFLRISTV